MDAIPSASPLIVDLELIESKLSVPHRIAPVRIPTRWSSRPGRDPELRSCALESTLPSLRLRLWHDAEIGLRCLPAFWIGPLRILIGDRARDDYILTVFPVYRGCDLMFRG